MARMSRASSFEILLRVASSMPAHCSLIARSCCDHPRWLRSRRTCGPMMLTCLIQRSRYTSTRISRARRFSRFVMNRSYFVTKLVVSAVRQRRELLKFYTVAPCPPLA